MIKITFLYIWDFCKFLFESNATQATKIHLIKYTVVIFLASSLFMCSLCNPTLCLDRQNVSKSAPKDLSVDTI